MTPAGIQRLEKTLTSIAILLAILLATGTAVGLIKKSRSNIDAGSKSAQNLIAKGKASALNAPVSDVVTAYFELGTIRLTTSDKKKENGTVMVISPWLSYPANDEIFYEELSKKRSIIKGLFSAYFTGRTKSQLLGKSEEIICAELLNEINTRLSLGKISGIYFTDYIFLE